MQVNKFGKYSIVVLATYVVFSIPIWLADMQTRQDKAKVYELVKVGQETATAMEVLMSHGFILRKAESNGTSQLVVVGDTAPNFFETLQYTTRLPWVPFTNSESPYVVIDSTDAGVITDIQ